MNRVYRLVWSDAANAWVAVAESARGRGKGASRKLIAAAILLLAAGAQAAPAGGQVTSGAAAITQSGLTTTIKQTSQNLSLNWQSFNVGAQETVNFVQPSASAIAVNRIYDTNGSQIMGRLNANGQVYLVNPNGILFGSGSQINVGGLVASTLNLDDASLNSSARSFSGNGPGRILNLGKINAASGGYVALLGNQVSNQGAIEAQLGTVVLGGGSAVTLNFNGNSLVNMVVDQSVLNSLAENGGLIKADGGMVMLSAGAKDTLLASMVNNTGDIEAHTIVNHEGKITLLGGMAAGTVNVAGTLDASAPNGGNGGFIETSAARVTVADAAKISTAAPAGLTGTWLIDPIDFTIAAGNAGLTTSGIGASTLSSNLGSTSVSIATDPSTAGSGDIFVNSAVSWSANKLTLSAHRNININANLNGSGTASLALEYGMGASNGVIGGVAASYNVNAAVNLAAGPNLSTKLGSSGALKNYTVITSLGAQGSTTATDLQGMQGNLTLNYALGSNIDASATTDWNSNAGFKPVGYTSGGATTFTGIFDGLGHTISNLTINRPGTVDVGLFGAAANYATISNVGLLNGRVVGGAGTGSLLGTAITASISNSYNTGTVSGAAGTGGLAGVITTGGVSGSYNTGTVSGAAGTGGLIGVLTTGSISDSYNIAAVTGNAGTGGLAGAMTTGSISNSFSTGNVIGNAGTGGLAGGITTGNVSGSYTTGNVTGDAGTGGLAGTVTTGSISDSYTTGNVVGAAGTGGLAGGITTGNVSSSFTTGTVAGAAGTSSLAGTVTAGSISNSFAVSGGQPIDFASFSASSASGKWVLSASGKPVLKSLIKTFTITANDVTQTYNGLSYSGGNSVSYSDPYQSYLTGTLSYTGTSQTARNAGSYGISAGGLSSTNSQYVVLYVGGTLTIAKANAVVTANSASTTYSGVDQSVSGFTASGLVGGDTAAMLTGVTAAGSGKNAGNYSVVAAGSDSNYNLTLNSGILAIAKADAVVTANSASTTYSGATQSVSGFTATGLVGSDTAAVLTGVTASGSGKNAGNYSVVAAGSDSNYNLTLNNGSLAIAKANAVVTANSASTTYSGATQSVNGFTATGLVGNETTAVLTGVTAAGSGKNAGNYSVVAAGSDSNYNLTLNNGSLAIAKANAVVTANSASTTYSGADQSVSGFTATGLVGGETTAVLSGVTASGTGKNAGNYSVVAAGTDSNYNLTLNSGTLAIAKADAIVTANSSSTTYSGATQSVNGFTATGLVGGETTAVLSGVSASVTAKNAGNYSVVAAGSDSNYNLTLNNGSLAIAKADAIVTANSASTTYSGATQNVSGFTATGLVGGETATVLTGVTASGSGKNAGNYSVVAAGTDANYNLTLNNGSLAIAKAALSLNATSGTKVYDGNTSSADVVTALGLVGSDTVNGTSQAFSSKNVLGSAGSTLQVNTGYVVNDGNNGGNYTVTTNSATGSITRLNSVAWIGGATGNWFDAANWQGGAVPDLSNVANVSIPTGVSVNFNNANASSVLQGGLVQVDSIGNLGALNMAQGNLNVANNLTLAALTQTGGALGGTGNVSVNSFNQSGGSVLNTGNFSVTNAFTQTGTGIVAVGGNMAIAQLSGDLNTSSLSGNNINLTANNGAAILGAVTARGVLSVNATGNITQTSSSVVTSGSGSTLASRNGDIVLPNTGNDQDGIITVSAVNITLTDASNPVFALSATGNSTLVSGGNLTVSGVSNNLTTTSLNGTTRFGATTINGNLSTTSSGSVSQTSPVTVSGSASINTNGFDLTTILSDNAIVVTPPAPAPAPAPTPAPAPAPANLSADVQTIGLTVAASVSTSFAAVSNSASLAAKNSPEAAVAVNTSSTEESSEVEVAEN
jgi:filamentous hemagglutinin family protein